MSNIPYLFETPIPKYFREAGWFNSPNTVLFVSWAFSKCSTQSHKTVMDGKEITIAPYEFIAGRLSSPKECHLSEDAFRHQLNTQLKVGNLKKTPNSAPNRFTCYIWVTERFSNVNPQLNPQSTPNSPPTEPPQTRIKQEDIACLKETSKKRKVAASLPLSQKEQEDAEGLFAYLSTYSISMPAINRWIKLHSLEKILKTTKLMESKCDKIKNHGGWFETALNENYAQEEEFRLLNREFAIKFQNENNLKVLKINKNYCLDIETQADYQYKLPPEDFQNMLKRKYIG